MTVRDCEACGEAYIPEGNELLCPTCNSTIDLDTKAMIEDPFNDDINL